MGVMMWFNMRQSAKVGFPSPVDGTSDVYWLDKGCQEVESWAEAGFSAVLSVDPLLQSSNLSSSYSPFWEYDFNQRAGTREMHMRFHSMVKANGMQIGVDIVNHQRNGSNGGPGVYNYKDADGGSGKFPKILSYFTIYKTDAAGNLVLDDSGQPTLVPGSVPLDAIAGPVIYDIGPYAFGDLVSTQHSLPQGVVLAGLIDAGEYLCDSLDVDFVRIDDTKGQAASSVYKYLTSGKMATKLAFGEHDDGNVQTLEWWIHNSGMRGRALALDFNLHYVIESMCNNTSRWDMRQLVNSGLSGVDSYFAVTWVESLDSDTDGFATVIWNKVAGYAFLLMYLGYPMVSYKDYAVYNLKPWIDNLIWIHNKFANGPLVWRLAEYQYIAFERIGGQLIFAQCNDQYNGWYTVSHPTSIAPGTWMHDVSGNNPVDFQIDKNGWATYGIPPNDNGHNYVCFVPRGEYGSNAKLTPRTTTQIIYGGAGYPVKGLTNGVNILPFKIYGSVLNISTKVATGKVFTSVSNESIVITATGLTGPTDFTTAITYLGDIEYAA